MRIFVRYGIDNFTSLLLEFGVCLSLIKFYRACQLRVVEPIS